jgi:hypothetical protein
VDDFQVDDAVQLCMMWSVQDVLAFAQLTALLPCSQFHAAASSK